MSAAPDPEVDLMWEEIKARPRELEPRRRLARRLSEKGDPLGELLTLMLMTDEQLGERNREDKRTGHAYKFLAHREARAKALMEEHGNTWFPKPPDGTSSIHQDTLKGRGVPDNLTLFSFTKDPLEQLTWFTARWPLRTLSIATKDPAPVIDAVEAGGHFTRLEKLSLEANHWSPAALEALQRASPGTLEVKLSTPTVAPIDRSSLLSARVFAETTTLRIVKTPLAMTVLKTIWANFPKLETLQLYQAMPNGLPQLDLKPLRELDVAGPWLADQTIALMKGLELRSLQRLALKEEAGTRDAIRWITDAATHGRFESLEELVLQESWIDDDHVEALALVLPKSLRILDLDRSLFGAKGVAALAELANSGRCPKLEAIRMWNIFVGTGQYTGGNDGGGLWEPTPIRETELTLDKIRQKFGFPAGLKLH